MVQHCIKLNLNVSLHAYYKHDLKQVTQEFKNYMTITKERKEEIAQEYGGSENNTGSTEAQVAIFTERITALTEHLKGNEKDHASRRGLLQMVAKRRKLLDYLKENDVEKYRELIDDLNLRK